MLCGLGLLLWGLWLLLWGVFFVFVFVLGSWALALGSCAAGVLGFCLGFAPPGFRRDGAFASPSDLSVHMYTQFFPFVAQA